MWKLQCTGEHNRETHYVLLDFPKDPDGPQDVNENVIACSLFSRNKVSEFI